MPTVGGKKYPYTKKGKMAAKKAMKGKPHMPGSKKSGMDPHAVQDKWEKKQMDMLSMPKKKKNMGDNFKGAYGGK